MKKQSEKIGGLNSFGVDLVDFVEPYHEILDKCIEEFYGEGGLLWFNWFCHESEFGEKDFSKYPAYKRVDGKMVKSHEAGEIRWGATDGDGNPICHSVLSTWEYLQQNFKKK